MEDDASEYVELGAAHPDKLRELQTVGMQAPPPQLGSQVACSYDAWLISERLLVGAAAGGTAADDLPAGSWRGHGAGGQVCEGGTRWLLGAIHRPRVNARNAAEG